jgi:diguanylate cyclase (GGDEF)-like protein
LPNSYEFSIKWHQRLRVKALGFFVLLAISVIGVTTITISVIIEDVAEHIAYEKLSHSQQRVLTRLSERTKIATTLANSMASVALETYTNNTVLQNAVVQLINNTESKAWVIGGGVWPEPFRFNTQKVRDSYFWSRNQQGDLIFYDDYNQEGGNGYHREEWYVPSEYLQPGQVYWSKSYVDPFTLQSMVTVTSPIIHNQQYIGATTIDLMLDGLQNLLKDSTERFNGYAFAVDRNGHLLSFPDEKLAQSTPNKSGKTYSTPFITIKELAQKHSAFEAFSAHLEINHSQMPSISNDEKVYALAIEIRAKSAKVNFSEALLIANSIVHPNKNNGVTHKNEHIFSIDNDYFLKEPALAVASTMPLTGWHIVTVMPLSEATSSQLIAALNLSISLIMLIAIVLAGLLLKRIYADPLKELMNNLKGYIDSDDVDSFIQVKRTSEFGELAHWFNQRTNELLATQEQVNSLAFYDPLTGLPNRKMLKIHIDKKLVSAQKNNKCGAIIYLDLDHFKIINDSLGHDIGDKLLIEFRKRLTSCLRKEDMAGRLGGDEFIVVFSVPNFKNHDKTKVPSAIAQKILSSLTEPFLLAGHLYHITASIGIAFFDEHSKNTEEILKYADSAMYNSKSNNRGSFCFFEEGMQIKADKRLHIEKDLRLAIKNNELSLAYQPQITHDNKCPSLEALVRWTHPEDGYISPLDFISIAEESMLILLLGDWVITNTCQQIKTWENQGIIFDHVSINISPIQFQQVDFIHNLSHIIKEVGVRPEKIMVELTEGVIINNPDRVAEKIVRLRNAGIRVSIDDFGTGYSSLNYLKKLPLDELKIDRSFIQEITKNHADEVITETIINMARNFGYSVIAEGVEEAEQRDLLIAKGCNYFQGFFFSRPLPPSEIPNYVRGLEPFTVTKSDSSNQE